MTTQVFFRKSSEAATCDRCSLATNSANLRGTNVGWGVPKPLRTTRGGAKEASAATATVAGTTLGVEVIDPDSGSMAAQWISPPLDQAVTISGTVTFNLWMGESATAANAGAQCVIERLDPTGAVASTVVNSEKGTEMPKTSSIAAQNWTASPTSTAFNKGDRIRIRVAGNDAGGTMASGNTFLFDYAAASAAADGDSYVTFNETFGFLTTDPAVSTVYPTDTASDINPGAATEKEAWLSRGGGVATTITNTTAGWTAPIQVTATAGGTAVEWFTKPLEAFTLSAPVLANVRAMVSSGGSGAASVRAEVAVTAADGTSPSVWGATSYPLTIVTLSEQEFTFYLAGSDTAVNVGQRLRIRLYIDDNTDAAMLASAAITNYYAGSSGATGDMFLTFGQTITNPLPFLVTQVGTGSSV